MEAVTRYACDHIGRVTGRDVRGFIRVAEIRGASVTGSGQKCPDCKKRDFGAVDTAMLNALDSRT